MVYVRCVECDFCGRWTAILGVMDVTKVKFEGQGKKPQYKGNEKLTQADIERLMGMRNGRRDGKLVQVYNRGI